MSKHWKDQVNCVKGMKEYGCALGTDCLQYDHETGEATLIEKGEEHLTHAQQGEQGIFSERYHKDCWPEYSHLARGESVRL